MTRSRLTYILLIAVVVIASFAGASANPTVKASVDRTNVAVGQRIKLQVTVTSPDKDISNPTFPDMRPFQVYSSGRTQNITWINGKMNSSITFDYGLLAQMEGEHSIGPIKVKIGNESYEAAPIKVTITPARVRQPGQSTQPQEPTADERQQSTTAERRIFINTELDRDTAFVNQPVTYTFRFYQGERLLQNPEYTKPNFPGFWVEDLPPQRKYSKIIDGVRYEVTEIRYALFATDAGPKRISPAQLKAKVSGGGKKRGRQQFSPFNDDFLGLFDRGEIVQLSSNAVELTVLPFPTEGQPSNFGGLVGSFSLTAELDSNYVTVGDPLTVKLTIAGEGNIEGAPMPAFDTLPDMRTFSAGSSQEVSTEGYKISGTKVYEQVFVPQRPGAYQLPTFALTYFDPNAKRYRTLQTDTLRFTATGAAADFTIPSLRLNPDELSDLASDVRFIRTNADDLRRRSYPGLFGWPFWAGHAVPLLALAVFVGWRRRTMKLASDPVGRKRRAAYRQSLLGLARGESPDAALSMDDVATALSQYFSDRFNRPAHGARRQDIRDAFLSEGVDESAVSDYLSLLEEADRSKYARVDGSSAAVDAARRAREILARLEGVSE